MDHPGVSRRALLALSAAVLLAHLVLLPGVVPALVHTAPAVTLRALLTRQILPPPSAPDPAPPLAVAVTGSPMPPAAPVARAPDLRPARAGVPTAPVREAVDRLGTLLR